VKLSGYSILAIAIQLKKTPQSIYVNLESGPNVTVCNLEHSANEPRPTDVTVAGIRIVSKFGQEWHMLLGIDVNLGGKDKDINELQLKNVLDPFIVVIRLSSENLIDVNPVSRNALELKDVNFDPMVTSCSDCPAYWVPC
jgi:hypothetical protein